MPRNLFMLSQKCSTVVKHLLNLPKGLGFKPKYHQNSGLCRPRARECMPVTAVANRSKGSSSGQSIDICAVHSGLLHRRGQTEGGEWDRCRGEQGPLAPSLPPVAQRGAGWPLRCQNNVAGWDETLVNSLRSTGNN